MRMIKVLFSLPSLLVLILLGSFTVGAQLPEVVKATTYAMSLSIKSGLVFVLPAIIFAYIFKTLATISRQNALFLVLLVVSSYCLSNLFASLFAFFIGQAVSHQEWLTSGLKISQGNSLSPLWELSLPNWIANEKALLGGFVAGLLAQLFPHSQLKTLSIALKNGADFFLNRIFIPMVPFFVLGFSLKLQHEGTLSLIAKNYGPILILFLLIEVSYIGLLFWIGSGFQFKEVSRMLKNAFPSMLSGFSTMSSAGTMPLTLKGAEKNTGRPELAQAIVPMTVNNHLIGDTLFICLMGLIFRVSFGNDFPTFIEYLPFCLYFALSMFAMAAVPGGGIIVMMPILEKYLGLNSETLSLMTTLYILFDPINTAANIAGNGAFTVILSRLYARWRETPETEKNPSMVSDGVQSPA